MDFNSISGTSTAKLGWDPMHAVSGASTYVPDPTSTLDPQIAQLRNEIKQNSQDFKALKTSLSSNDLAGATQAYQTLQNDIRVGSSATGGKSPFSPDSPIGKDFEAIGAALKSGDSAAAKRAFSDFTRDIRSAGRAARHEQRTASNTGLAGDPDAPLSGRSQPPLGPGTGFNVTA